jgi:hypothetical protein
LSEGGIDRNMTRVIFRLLSVNQGAIKRSNKMKIRCFLIGVVILFVVGVLNTSSYAKIDPKTIVGMWLFDDGKGGIAKDSSGNKNDGELINGPEWVGGKFGKALKFDGMDDYVYMKNSENSNPTNAITLSVWVNPSDFTGEPELFSKWVAGTCIVIGSGANVTGSGCLFFVVRPPNLIIEDSKSMTLNTWHHVAATFDGSAIRLYKNGIQVNSAKRPESLAIVPSGWAIGGLGPALIDSTYCYAGLIDEAAVFNVALNDDDIKRIMNVGLEAASAVSPAGKLATTRADIKIR